MYSETINSDVGPNNHHKTLIDIPYHFISHYYIILRIITSYLVVEPISKIHWWVSFLNRQNGHDFDHFPLVYFIERKHYFYKAVLLSR